MRSFEDFRECQVTAYNHCIDNPEAGLFMEMGLGKTAVGLTVSSDLLFDHMSVNKVLIIAPLKVAESTWLDEISEWEHLAHLRLSRVIGTEKQRIAALRANADIYIINRENVVWLVAYYQSKWPFDMVIVDELSSFKSSQSKRFKALKLVRPMIKRFIGMTGTPRPNGIEDLFSQMFLIDKGARLGKTITGFRSTYLKPAKQNGHIVYKYDPIEGAEKAVYDKISDLCLTMRTRDYVDLPSRLDVTKWVRTDGATHDKYIEFAKELVLELENVEITAAHKAALNTKLRQFANGAVYKDLRSKDFIKIHDHKLTALEELIEEAGEPMLLFYQYQSDVVRIMEKFKKLKPVLYKTDDDLKKWNSGKIPLFITHAQSAGHGVNMQFGGRYCTWFGLSYSSEEYEQGTGRLDRPGQKDTVINTRLLVKGTVDEKCLDVVLGKVSSQDAMMDVIKELRRHLLVA